MKSSSLLPFIIAGIALGIGGVQYSFLCVLAMLLLLGVMGCKSGPELLLVASVCGGKAVCQILHILILNPNLYRLSRTLEFVAIAVFGIVLLITQMRILAGFLVVYFAFMVVLLLWSEFLHFPKAPQSRLLFSDVIIDSLMAWLLVQWLGNNKRQLFER